MNEEQGGVAARFRPVWPVLLAACIVAASSLSMPEMPVGLWNADKLVHFAVFGLLATATVRVPALARRAWLAVLLVSLFGAADEVHQGFTPGRSPDPYDWLADTLGALVAVAAYTRWPGYRRLLERRPAHPASRRRD
jgi:VanZ family protein